MIWAKDVFKEHNKNGVFASNAYIASELLDKLVGPIRRDVGPMLIHNS